jgi:vacuolar iron transporter family protein
MAKKKSNAARAAQAQAQPQASPPSVPSPSKGKHANGNGASLLSATASPSSASNYSNYGALNDDVRSAHANGDAEKSRQLHQLKIDMAKHGGHAMENHMTGGDYIKSAVYGGLDGIITTFATVTSVAGSGLPHSVILIIGLAHLVADGLSMGLGDMLSSQAEADLVKHERARETWEFENYPEGEMEEMIELYEKKGIATDDAKLVVQTLAKYKEAFIDIMMVEELNLMPTDDEDSPLKGGIITFVSFMLFGVIPLLSYLVNLIPGLGMSPDTTFNASCVLTVITLFLLGAVKGSFVGQRWYMSGGSMAVNGSIAAFCGWLIGYLLKLTGIQDVA